MGFFSRKKPPIDPPRPPAREARTAHAVAKILGERAATVADVGARWGNTGAWYRLDPLARTIGFEPDPEEHARLAAAIPASSADRVYAVALGDRDARATLHVTKNPGCSSLLPPNVALADRYPALDVIREERTLDVELTRLDTWAAREGVRALEVMKLDVQGFELAILEGAGSFLDGTLGLEIEVEFVPIYEGQPLFADVERWLRARGFALWRLSHLVHYAERHTEKLARSETAAYDGVTARADAGVGRLAWANAIFVRDYAGESVATREGLARVLVIAALLDAADDLDGAAAALRRALGSPAIEARERAIVEAEIAAIERVI